MPQRAPHDSSAPTLGGPSGPSRAPSAAHPEGAGEMPRRLGRFEFQSLLGEGGMGRVYAAYDPELRRDVAVKLLRVLNPATVGRFVREARTQASVFHPNVCPVLEAGTVDGQPYIVMPRIDGEPLDEAARDLPVEQKLLLMRHVADAVHAAHQAGLVHRDLKPSNILVERTEDGLLPRVLDFGLARLESEPGYTRTGDVVGTPAYMAPEQVRGDVRQLDRRSDVYSLGACLYALLAGHSLFGGSKPSIFVQILEDDPEPLRPLGVPPDVEAVVLKCLEKDPNLRFGSARELVDDLDRYLVGEPVSARSTGRWYRFGKWVRRHAALVRLGAMALVVLLATLAWAFWRADRRETVARELTSLVEEIDAVARYSAMSPLHDIRPDRELIRRQMQEIEDVMSGAGALGRAAGDYALGRGFLALGDLDAARLHLERAWSNGHRDSDAASALARTLSGLYRRELAELELVRDWASRQTRRDELERVYGDPTRLYLEESLEQSLEHSLGGGTAADPYLVALSDFHRDRFAEAIASLRATQNRRPWLYELDLLEGDVWSAWAVEAAAADDLDLSRQRLESARLAFGRAASTAPSDSNSYLGITQVGFRTASLESAQDGAVSALSGAMTGLERWLRLNPDDGEAWLWKARIHRAAALRAEGTGGDALAEVNLGLEASDQAVHYLPARSAAWREQGRARWAMARWRQNRGLDPNEFLASASSSLDAVPLQDRDYSYLVFRGMVERTHAQHLADSGDLASAIQRFENAVDAYQAARALHSDPFSAAFNAGSTLLAWVPVARLEERGILLDRAVQALEAASSSRPDHFAPLLYLGRVRILQARGGDPLADGLDRRLTAEAIDLYRQAEALAPTSFQVQTSLGEAWHLLAIADWDDGVDPKENYASARRAHQRAIELAPDHPIPRTNLAWTDYFEGKHRIRAGLSPGLFLDAAINGSRRVLAESEDASARLCLASALRMSAEHRVSIGEDPTTELEAANDALLSLLETDPTSAEAHRSLGRLQTLEGEWYLRVGKDPWPPLLRAEASIQRALELHSGLARSWLARADLARVWRQAGSDEAVIWGRASATRALELRPGWTRAEQALADLKPILQDR